MRKSNLKVITNEFKSSAKKPGFIKEPLHISDAEMALYKWVGLKISYEQSQVDKLIPKPNDKPFKVAAYAIAGACIILLTVHLFKYHSL